MSKASDDLQHYAVVGTLAALGGWVVYKYVANAIPTIPTPAELTNRYLTSVVTNADGSVNVAATLGITNPSNVGNIGGHNATAEEVRILQYAHNYGVQIVWKNTDFGNNPEIDYASTLRDVALAAGIMPASNWFGMFSTSGTLALLDNTMTVTR
jgi:hypothetical protein